MIMKKIFRLMLSALALTLVFTSCKKDENRISYEGGTPPALSANKATITLAYLTRNDEAVKFLWTNPEYKFTTGINSQDVNYLLEFDNDGANFSSPNKFTVAISKELSRSFTQGDINDILLNKLLLTPGVSKFVEVRIKSYLATNAVTLISNVLRFQVTPYAIPPKVTPPANLYIVGSATPGSWNNPVPVPSQEFAKINPTLFEITINISAGGSYLFLPVNGSWSAKYGCLGANNTNNVNGDDFKDGGGDMLAPAVGGNYKIQVDFQRGVFTLTKL